MEDFDKWEELERLQKQITKNLIALFQKEKNLQIREEALLKRQETIQEKEDQILKAAIILAQEKSKLDKETTSQEILQ